MKTTPMAISAVRIPRRRTIKYELMTWEGKTLYAHNSSDTLCTETRHGHSNDRSRPCCAILDAKPKYKEPRLHEQTTIYEPLSRVMSRRCQVTNWNEYFARPDRFQPEFTRRIFTVPLACLILRYIRQVSGRQCHIL